ncbi:MAG: alpha-2-macroglobulin [Paraprevotella sp.]|uniref:alpha-2-macroglobulin family protein n=1 Tax=Paraprevotella sp. TaxID=2049036 RepID=UPI002580EA7C|nr:alpha-2-macroglobulin family protein [Paraprevotella sp.]MBS4806587.1 alpha-2-macroglobulin [Paraprevotella sp.]
MAGVKSFFCVLWSLCLCGIMVGRTADYDALWKQVRQFERQGLTKSAYEVVEQIGVKAEKEHKEGQQMAVLIYGCKLRQCIVPDSFYADIVRLEKLKRDARDEVRRAVWASVLAGLYKDNAGRNRSIWLKKVKGPERMREWASGEWKDASDANFDLSLSHPDLLAEVKAADYLPFIEQGEHAAYFGGDLLNVIGRRAVMARKDYKAKEDREAVAGYCAKMLQEYRSRRNREAELLVLLDSLAQSSDEMVGETNRFVWEASSEERERKELDERGYGDYCRLLYRFGDLPLAAEVYLQWMDWSVTAKRKIEWAEEGWKKYASYPRAKKLRERKDALQAPYVSISKRDILYPGKTYRWTVNYRNTETVALQWFRMPETVRKDSLDVWKERKMLADFVKGNGRLVKSVQVKLKEGQPWEDLKDTLEVETPGLGLYVVCMRPEGTPGMEEGLLYPICVTRFRVVTLGWPDSCLQCRVMDETTGKPVEDAEVEVYVRDSLTARGVTAADGAFVIRFPVKEKRSLDEMKLHVAKGEDRYLFAEECGWEYRYNDRCQPEEDGALYTDREVYRPGQTVYVGGLCMIMGGGEERVLPRRKFELRLKDSRGKTWATKEVVSDEMGTVATEFVLPRSCRAGRYYITGIYDLCYFNVEEYKRPAFEVKLDKRKELGDTVFLMGKARNFMGVPVRDARVTATSSSRNWVYSQTYSEKEPVALDTVYTDAEGCFVLPLPLNREGRRTGRGSYRIVDVYVTDRNGQTQNITKNVPTGPTEMQIGFSVGSYYWHRDRLPSVKVGLREINGGEHPRTARVFYHLFRYGPEGRLDTVWMERPIQANVPVTLTDVRDLASGEYRLQMEAVAGEDTVRARARDFVLLDSTNTRPINGSLDWFDCVEDTIAPGCPGRIEVGSAGKDVTLFYTLLYKDRVLADTLYTISDTILTFSYPQALDYGDVMEAVFYFVKDGSMYKHRQTLKAGRPSKQLRMEWTSFRDGLQPGTEETWKLRVVTTDGRPASAQVMATLYDASLEGKFPHQWSVPYKYCGSWVYYSFNDYDGNYFSLDTRKKVEIPTVKNLCFDTFGANFLNWRKAMEDVQGITKRESQIYNCLEESPRPAPLMRSARVEDGSFMPSEGQGKDEDDEMRIPIRRNLNETAFFYPRLMADENGEVTIRFTLPESLTTWKFMALAHTEDMMTGTFTDEAVASKDVMARLDLPRFVRMGDHAALSASLYNLTQKTIKGKVTMEVFDPATEKTLWKKTRKLEVAASADTVVTFTYVPVEGVTLSACRVLFEADSHSDGEQRYLPVLEDKEWLTQTLPFVVSHAGDTVIHLDGLFQNHHSDASRRNLTVEYTANPLWYAVTALPSVLEPSTDDAQTLSAAYYASTLSTRLSSLYPQLKNAVDLWLYESGEELEGSLSMPEEPAGVVSDETPWMIGAKRETRLMQELQQLFDRNRQRDLRRQFAESLGKLQREDGSFGWFNGMSGSMYMTYGVARALLRSTSGIENDSVLTEHVDVRQMMEYLFGRAHEDVQRDKENLRVHKVYAYGCSRWLDYLYLATLCPEGWLTSSSRKDMDYMRERLLECLPAAASSNKKRLMGDEERMSLPEMAEAAVVFQRMGKAEEAELLMTSLREHLVDDAEGLHLEYPSNGFYGSARKIAVHTMLMEAFLAEEFPDSRVTEGLCRWLLAQKCLQDWGTSTGSVDAIYALLQGQPEGLTFRAYDAIRLLSPQGKELAHAVSSVGDWVGLGAVSVSVGGDDLKKGAGALAVTKTEERPSSWGAAYACFQLPLDEVESSASGLRIRQEVDNEHPRVGDRVTLRYVLTSDRDYEYVRLKAGRAACLEPVESRSGYEYRNGLGYYKEVKDASTNYFFERLPKGTYVIEAECYVERAGRYALGAVKLNGVYAPEFTAYGAGTVLEVSE